MTENGIGKALQIQRYRSAQPSLQVRYL